MLGDVNRLFVFKSLLTTPSNILPLHLKQTFPPMIWIFTDSEGDGIESELPFKKFSTLIQIWFDRGLLYYMYMKGSKGTLLSQGPTVQIFWEGHTIWINLSPFLEINWWLAASEKSGRLIQICVAFSSSQNIWTLT